MKRINVVLVALVFSIFVVGINPLYANIIDGVEGGSIPEVNVDVQESSNVIEPSQAATVINFDDVVDAPCSFIDTTALRNHYAGLGVYFSGPGNLDGGAILDECGNFGVSGHSPPKFLAFNTDTELMDGGIPRGPETITFNPPVSKVQMNVGGRPTSGTIKMDAYNAAGNFLGSDQVGYSLNLQTISVSVPNISKVVVSFTEYVLVIDDLAFERGGEWPSAAYDYLFAENKVEALRTFRMFRDEVLMKHPICKDYVVRLYDRSYEVGLLLLLNPILSSQAAGIMNELRPNIENAFERRLGAVEVVPSKQQMIEKINRLLNAFARKASPKLRALINDVKAELKNKDTMSSLGLSLK